MEPKELRDGNYYYHSGDMLIHKFKADDLRFRRWEICDFVPITIDMLEDNELDGKCMVNNLTVFLGVIEVKYDQFSNSFDVFINGINIRSLRFVHELQNWWYWTTGEELNFKLHKNE